MHSKQMATALMTWALPPSVLSLGEEGYAHAAAYHFLTALAARHVAAEPVFVATPEFARDTGVVAAAWIRATGETFHIVIRDHVLTAVPYGHVPIARSVQMARAGEKHAHEHPHIHPFMD